jgi:hypothetical protein
MAKAVVARKETAERMQRSQKQAEVTGSALYMIKVLQKHGVGSGCKRTS